MQAVLVMFRSDGERRSFSVVRNITVVGRREDCDLRIPLGDISRKHCRLVKDGDTIRLEDLGSSNGTYHNGVRVEREVVLSPGDSIQVGPVVFVLQIDGVPADDELHPLTAEAAGAPGMDAAPAMPALPAGYDAAGEEDMLPLEGLDTLDALSIEDAAADSAAPTMGSIEGLDALPLDDLHHEGEGHDDVHIDMGPE